MNAHTTDDFIRLQAALAGRYSLQRELGRGGMGIVYLAHEVALQRPVAIKLLEPGLASRPALRQRFLNEARTAAKLSHPHIIPIFAVDEAGGFVFFVMAFIDGETLGQRIRGRGPLTATEAARVLREIGWGLAYAHAQGVVHRDVKADNIMLERGSGRALIVDFGIARLADAEITGSGELIGTADYMSPEQASGDAADHRSDIYSLGVVGYYALTGRLPFAGGSIPAVLSQHLTLAPVPIAERVPGLPVKLTDAVERCLAKDPAERFASAEELADVAGTALELRREAPLPIRGFFKQGSVLTQNLMFITFFQAVLALFGGLSLLTPEAIGANVLLGLAGIALVADPLLGAGMLAHMRRLLKSGYTREDLLAAWQKELHAGEHERTLEHGRAPDMLERGMRWLFPAGIASVVAATAAAIAGLNDVSGVLGLFGWTAGFWGGVIALWRHDARTALSQRLTGRLLDSKLGRWAFGLAGAGLDRKALASMATDRPTELAIALAVDALFEALPKETRRHLGDLPGIVRHLELQAMKMREQVERLTGVSAPDLAAQREAANRRLAEAVTALENIRLDLLRLTAGQVGVESLTADLSGARALSEDVDRLLQARGEIERHLATSTSLP